VEQQQGSQRASRPSRPIIEERKLLDLRTNQVDFVSLQLIVEH